MSRPSVDSQIPAINEKAQCGAVTGDRMTEVGSPIAVKEPLHRLVVILGEIAVRLERRVSEEADQEAA
jgi:hypothetical protein